MQIYGFMRIYDAKQGGVHGRTQRLDLALCFAIFVAGAVQLFYGWPSWTLTLLSFAIVAVPLAIQVRAQRNPAKRLAERYAANAVVVPAKPRPEPEPAAEAPAEGASA